MGRLRFPGAKPSFRGGRLTSPRTPSEPQPPAPHRPGARPSHFPPPSSEETENSRHPAEGGRSAGLVPTPPPGAKPARGARSPLPEDGDPPPTAAGPRPRAPEGRGTLSSPHTPGAAKRPRSPPSYTLPPGGRGAA